MGSRGVGILACAVALLVVLAGALHSWRGQLDLPRQPITSSPGLEPLFGRDDVIVGPRQKACMGPATVDPATAVAQLKLTPQKRPAAFSWSLTGAGGYRATGRATVGAPGVLQPVMLRIPSPPASIDATFCLRNAGRAPIALLASNEPQSQTSADTTLAGKPLVGRDATLLFLEARPRSLAARMGTIVDRASLFAGGWLPPWLLWLAIVALPATGVLALLAGLLLGQPRGGTGRRRPRMLSRNDEKKI